MTRANTLKHLNVTRAMRRQLTCLDTSRTISQGIAALIKYKINALLIVNDSHEPIGVVSKTDIMGAYYAGLPTDTPLEMIMISPPLFCAASISLETALEQMRCHQVYRLYVCDDDSGELLGVLAYPDIVGLLYQYCHRCPHSHLNKNKQVGSSTQDMLLRFQVKELMTPGISSLPSTSPLTTVMETLSEYKFGALLICGDGCQAVGVVSKTDLALAYKHGISQDVHANEIMNPHVHSCSSEDYLEDAIKKMIIADIHRLFVSGNTKDELIGVISLTDAARGRSGSCHGCVSSRIKLEEQP